jgi:glycosyltransferase involved in cell wall biosynthesis
MATIIKEQFPRSRVFTIADPLQVIGDGARPRDTLNLLFICSFDYDEPVRLILETATALPEFTFIITADVKRLPSDLQRAFAACANVRLTGFLSTNAYQSVLCSSRAAVVLTTMPAVQPSGACEALSSNTPLVLTRTSLTKSLFGGWAVLVDNSIESLVTAIRSLNDDPLDLNVYRNQWNQSVRRGIVELEEFLGVNILHTKVAPIRKV